jgi:hypothetical protein
MVVGLIPPMINPQLLQVGHVPMFIQTHNIMTQEGACMLSLTESSSDSYNDDEMRTFFRTVATARGITGTNVNSWVGKVHNKLGHIGVSAVYAMVSSIVMLNQKLCTARLPVMHSQTVKAMAQAALLHEVQEPSDE